MTARAAAGPWDESPLEYALAYAAVGLRVLPIRPGSKYPPMQAWQDAATTNDTILRSWWTQLYAGHGCGLALGRWGDRWVFALDLDEHQPGVSGRDTLEQLEQEHGPLPVGPRALTGAGGLHLLFEAPCEIRNGTLGPGVDVRGQGGQIVVAPSIHPDTGVAYAWEHDHAPWDLAIPPAPEWLVEQLRPPPPRPKAPPSATGSSDDPTPAEWLRDGYDWAGELEAAGWQLEHTSNDGEHWTRPHKDLRLGPSALLHDGGPLVIFSTDASMAPYRRAGTLNRDGSVSLSPIELHAAIHHDGNVRDASSAVRARMPRAHDGWWEQQPSSAENTTTDEPEAPASIFVDWGVLWSREQAGEQWLAYPIVPAGRAVALYAKAKTGKSWIALLAAVAIATGGDIFGETNHYGPRHVMYLDYEMTEDDLLDRLEQLGYGPDTDLSHLHYALAPPIRPLDLELGAQDARRLAASVNAELVVIDTMGRAIAGDENDANSYRAYARLTGMLLKADGRAVLRTDHAGKDASRGQRGSSAKNDDVDVVLQVEPTERGWRIIRTMSRISWVPERTELVRQVYDGGDRMTVRLANGQDYLEGTAALVEQMRRLGIDHDWSASRAMAALREAGAGARKARVLDALRWMRTEAGNWRQPREPDTNQGTNEPPISSDLGRDRDGNRGNGGVERMEEPPPLRMSGGFHAGPASTDGLPSDVF